MGGLMKCMIKDCDSEGTIIIGGMVFCVNHITRINRGLREFKLSGREEFRFVGV